MSAAKPTPESLTATTFIYALADPRTREIRYIGKADKPKIRFDRHVDDAKAKREKCYKSNWIRSLLAKGLRPVLQIIDEVLRTEWQAAEAAYIQFYRDEGCPLVNVLSGGEGSGSGPLNHFYGKKHSPEAVVKMSVAGLKRGPPRVPNAARARGERHYLSGKHLAPDTKKKLSAALSGERHPHFGKPKPPEVRAKISASLKGEKHFHFGKKNTPEARAKMSAALKGRIFTPEHRRKLLEAAARRRAERARPSAGQLTLAL